MHDDELDVDEALVRDLLAARFPELAGLPIARFESTGTVNAVYRIGDELYGRFPRVPKWADGLRNEARWLPVLAPQVSLRIPIPVGFGEPTASYPCPWGVYEWIDGAQYADELIDDEHRAAADLARFISNLRRFPAAAAAPPAGRAPLRDLDSLTREAITQAAEHIDVDATMAAWDRALATPAFSGDRVWIHGDLLRANLLVQRGRLHAVLDFGSVGVGDPAADVTAAWAVFNPAARATFRSALDVDDDTWNRARGFALTQAALLIPYYRETNPLLAAQGVRTIDELVADTD